MLSQVLTEIAACQHCAADLPHEPRPVVQAAAGARLLIVGQAPGRKVHESGIPWNDASGDRLRAWLGVGPDMFYDSAKVALMPMGFCYPGVSRSGSGDAPPMRRCAPLWHERLLAELPVVRLTLLVGSYAQSRYKAGRAGSMTARVKRFEAQASMLALPHPSWRVVGWMQANPWFEADLLPVLQEKVAACLAA